MENKKLLEEIRSYWNNRADGYSRVNQEELHSEQKEKWKEVLLEQLPKKEKVADPYSGQSDEVPTYYTVNVDVLHDAMSTPNTGGYLY